MTPMWFRQQLKNVYSQPGVRFEIPPALRVLVRARESGLIILGGLIGGIAGLVVAARAGLTDCLYQRDREVIAFARPDLVL